MSEVIRDVVIRMRLEQQKANVQAPEVSAATRAYESQGRAAKEATKAVVETSHATREAGRSHAEAAEKNAKSHGKSTQQILSHTTEGLEGITRFSRGVALMSVSSEEDMHKLLVSLMKLQAGFDVVAGGAKFVKGMGLAFGEAGMAGAGLTLVLGAGAIAWNAYRQQVQKAEAELKAVNDQHRKAVASQIELQHLQKDIESKGAASKTDATMDPDAKRAALAKDLEDVRRSRAEEVAKQAEFETRRKQLQQATGLAESKARVLPGGKIDAFMQGYKVIGVDTEGDRAIAWKKQLTEDAERAKRGVKLLGGEEMHALERQKKDTEREKDILQQQRSTQLEEVDRIRSEAMSGALGPNAYQKNRIEFGGPRSQMMQRQERVDLTNQAFAQTARMFGAPVFTGKEVDEATAGKSKQINQAFDKLEKGLVDLITGLTVTIEKLKRELDGANSS